MIGSVLQHSQPYRSRTSGGILRTESWHQPVGLQHTGLKSHIYTYQTAHDLSPKKHFFKHPKQHPVSANEHDKTSKDIKNIQRFQEISSDISANERFIANIFAIYISELALSRVPPCFLYFSILHFVAWSCVVLSFHASLDPNVLSGAITRLCCVADLHSLRHDWKVTKSGGGTSVDWAVASLRQGQWMVGYGCRGEPILNHEMNSEIAGKIWKETRFWLQIDVPNSHWFQWLWHALRESRCGKGRYLVATCWVCRGGLPRVGMSLQEG